MNKRDLVIFHPADLESEPEALAIIISMAQNKKCACGTCTAAREYSLLRFANKVEALKKQLATNVLDKQIVEALEKNAKQ